MENTILILMSYYNRPILLREALNSILRSNKHYSHWRLAFADDGSVVAGEPIVREILHEHLDKCFFIHSNRTFEDKLEQGLLLGKMANEAIKHFESEADIAIMLADDDVLEENYLKRLNDYFNINPEVLYCYSHLYVFNPEIQKWDESQKNLNNRWNKFTEDINPVGNLDASQVAWRLKCNFVYGAWFKESTLNNEGPLSGNTDGDFYHNLFKKCGKAKFSGLVGEYKAVHDFQLLWHKDNSVESLREYNSKLENLAGKKF